MSLSLPDARLTHGKEYYLRPLQQMPLSFDVLLADDLTQLQARATLPTGGE